MSNYLKMQNNKRKNFNTENVIQNINISPSEDIIIHLAKHILLYSQKLKYN